jgi:hypothetical protein
MNNWNDSLAYHFARKLYKNDTDIFGPYLAGLHNASDWPTNQIDGATAFFGADVLKADGSVETGTGNGPPTGPDQPPTVCKSSTLLNNEAIAKDNSYVAA